jgi:hypothetical protein
MGARRDDITAQQRAQIAVKVMSAEEGDGTIAELIEEYGLSRQSIYQLAKKGEQVLVEHMEPGGHGPRPEPQAIVVDQDRLIRSTLVLTEVGVSQRDIEYCLREILDTSLTYGWVNGKLAQLEAKAQAVNESWQPSVQEMLAGDEIYANGQPNLLVVGNDSLYIYALSRQPDCTGETWGEVLSTIGAVELFASDAGVGLAAGVKAAGVTIHQLDWDHLLRPLWGQVARLERQVYADLEAVEERAVLFDKATTPGRLRHHLAEWERLNQIAEEAMTRFDALNQLARQVDDWFALIDVTTGQLPDMAQGIEQLKTVGRQLQNWPGRIYHKLSTHLQNWADKLFNYQPCLAQALQPLYTQYGTQAIAALSQMWQLEANQKRRPPSTLERQHQQRLWCQYLDQALALLGQSRLWKAWEQLCQILNRSWRGSMLAECVNSLLRPILRSRQHTDQGCLALFRFLHNIRPFRRGKRAGHSPASLVGLVLPDDPLSLLGLQPSVSI